jgi:hypothetical protein
MTKIIRTGEEETEQRRCLIAIQLLPASAHSLCQYFQHGFGIFPVNTSISNTDTVLEASLALWWDLLVTC